jgi:two-component system sensor histidine kinase RegB
MWFVMKNGDGVRGESIPALLASRDVLRWIVGARYALSAAQILVVLVVHFGLGLALPLVWLMLAPAITLLSNLHLSSRFRGTEEIADSEAQFQVLWAFVVDTIGFTVTLALTGGPTNPFSLLYLVQITLSAVLLKKSQTWLLGLLAATGYAALFLHYRPLPGLEMHSTDARFERLHLIGMWAAFVMAAILISLFSGKVSSLLRVREQLLLKAQNEIARQERLSSLVTLAAGAAHELATPLGTIAIVAKELEIYARIELRDEMLLRESSLIRYEVERCKAILQAMSAHGAEQGGESPANIRVKDLLAAAARNLPMQPHGANEVLNTQLWLPVQAVKQSLANLIKNAYEAAPEPPPQVQVTLEGGLVRFRVCDFGRPVEPEILRRIGEPFFTTKPLGEGMGLGVFLVRTMAERLDGSLTFDSDQSGTMATLTLPAMWKG